MELVLFDLDGTLAESKMAIDAEMSSLLFASLGVVPVAIISGGDWPQFEKQVLAKLPRERLANLSIAPTSGAKLFQYQNRWRPVYSEDLTPAEKAVITAAIDKAVTTAAFAREPHWGATVEDRGTQMTFSALGQEAPLEAKTRWDPDISKRKRLKSILDILLPGLSVRIGGSTSIDISRPGIDKAYGIRKLRDILSIQTKDMLFVGDALYVGGNDYPATETGAMCLSVGGPSDTKLVIKTILACSS